MDIKPYIFIYLFAWLLNLAFTSPPLSLFINRKVDILMNWPYDIWFDYFQSVFWLIQIKSFGTLISLLSLAYGNCS